MKRLIVNCLVVAAIFLSAALMGCNNEITDEKEWLSKDVLERIPDEILNTAKELGLKINGGKTPPNIEGSYYAQPVILINTTSEDGKQVIGQLFNNGTFIFSEQNNAKLTVLTYIEEMGVGSDTGVGSFITGNGKKFSVFVVMDNMYSETVYFLISGEIENDGIRNLQFLLLHEDLQGNLFKDGDGLAERITSTRSFEQKTSGTSSEPFSLWFIIFPKN